MATIGFRQISVGPLSQGSTQATSSPARPRSIKYKEETRALLKEIIAVAVKIKKTPDLYVKEVVAFIDQFRKLYEEVIIHPAVNDEKFIQVMSFLARVSHFYKDDMQFLVQDLMELLNHYQNSLNPHLRKKVVFSLMMLRHKGLIQPFRCLSFMMKLFNCQDKELRKIVFKFIIKDLKDQNFKHKNVQLNSQFQTFLVQLLKKSSDNVAKRAIQILIELYKRKVWNDTKTANIIASGAFSSNYKVRLLACYFLISTTEHKKEEFSSSEDEETYVPKQGNTKSVKPSKAREHRVEREKKKAIKKQRRKFERTQAAATNFFPLDVLHSAQDFAERLFIQVRKLQNDKFESKMASMAVITRLINRNKLILIPFYTFLQKYLYPTQKDIAKVLSYLAESTHDTVPAGEIEPIVNHLIEQFVNDRCSEQAMTMGLRTITEMIQKHSAVLTTFNLNYLASYSKYKNKNVSNSGKALVNVYRTQNPRLLEKKYRGKQWKAKDELDDEDEVYENKNEVKDYIEGADLLAEEQKSKGQSSTIPIYWDQVLSDADFKRIRALQRKKEEDEEVLAQSKKVYEDDNQEEEEDEEIIDDEEGVSDISGESEGVDGSDWEEDGEEGEEEELDEEEVDEEEEVAPKLDKNLKPKKSSLKQDTKKRRTPIDDLEGEAQKEDSVLDYYSSSNDESDQNPHGYVNPAQIGQFKLTRAQQKALKKDTHDDEVREKKFTHTNKKSEFASSTNKEKLKQKPLTMIRPKKNKLRDQMSTMKKTIKDLKNKLGHVRSGKQAQKLKKQKIK